MEYELKREFKKYDMYNTCFGEKQKQYLKFD